MIEADARALLERKVAHDQVPLLDEQDIDSLIALAKRPDSAGRLPSDAQWVPTWDLDAAAYEGWMWKAGRSAPDYSFTIEDETSHQNQVHQACLAKVREYADKLRRSGVDALTIVTPETPS